MADSGIDFAMIRVGYRGYSQGTLQMDERFQANIEGALDAGLDVGVYFFSQATTVAEAEEEAVLNSMVTAQTVTGYQGTVKRSLSEFMDQILSWRG